MKGHTQKEGIWGTLSRLALVSASLPLFMLLCHSPDEISWQTGIQPVGHRLLTHKERILTVFNVFSNKDILLLFYISWNL